MKGLIRNLSYNTVGMIGYNFAIWLLSAIILRVLGAEMSGYYAIASSVGNVFYAIALWGLRSYIATDVRHEHPHVAYAGARCFALICVILALGAFCLVAGYNAELTLAVVLYTLFKMNEAIIELMDCFCQQAREMDINAKGMLIRSAGLMFGFTAMALITGSLVSSLSFIVVFTLVVAVFYNYPKVKKLIGFEWSKEFFNCAPILKACFPIMVFELLASAVVAIPRLMYGNIGSTQELGIYTSIYSLVIFLQLVVNILIFTLAPYMGECYEKGDSKGFIRYCLVLIGGAVGLGLAAELCVLIMGRPVIGLLYGKNVADRYVYLYWGIISGVTLTFTWILSQIFVIMRRNSEQMLCAFISTGACFLLSRIMLQANDCNSISKVLALANMVYVIVAVILLVIKPPVFNKTEK